MIDSFYVRMDFGSSPPQWSLDPRLFSRGEVGFGGMGPGIESVFVWCESGLKKNGIFCRKFPWIQILTESVQ